VVLNLTETWLGRENTALTSELLSELPGILNWALDGLKRLVSQGHFTEPKTSRDAVVALQDLASPVAAFVRDRCQRGPHSIACKTLYNAWKDWALEMGHPLGTEQTFGRDLRAVIPGLRASRPREGNDRVRIRRYWGVTLTKHYNGSDRGPLRTKDDVVRDGPRPRPLYPQHTSEREPGQEG
jgi:putative DNA primase/helicase